MLLFEVVLPSKRNLKEAIMAKFNKQGGFTLVELVLVILIIGILAAVALPKFNAVSDQARDSKTRAIASAIKQAVQNYRLLEGNGQSFPTALSDDDSDGTCDGVNCANHVLGTAITDSKWTQSAAGTVLDFAEGTYTATITYTPASGAVTITSSTGNDMTL